MSARASDTCFQSLTMIGDSYKYTKPTGIKNTINVEKPTYPTYRDWMKAMINEGKIELTVKKDKKTRCFEKVDDKSEPNRENIFTAAKNKTVQELKLLDANEKKEIQKMKTEWKAINKVTQSSNMKILPGYRAKKFIYMEKLKEKKNPVSISLPTTLTGKTVGEKLRDCPIPLYVLLKKELCRINHGVIKKQEEMEKLIEQVEQEELNIENEIKELEAQKDKYDNRLTETCRRANDANRKAELMSKQKKEVIEKIKKVTFKHAHLNTKCLKLEETFKKLKKYRKFIDKVTPDSKKAIMYSFSDTSLTFTINDTEETEKTVSTPDILGITLSSSSTKSSGELEPGEASTKGTESILTFNTINVSDKTEVRQDKPKKIRKDHLTNESNEFNINNIETNKTNSMNNPRDSCLNSPSVSIHVPNTIEKCVSFSVEDDACSAPLFFNNPEELRNILMDLEESDLKIIQNVQEVDELCEQTKTAINEFKAGKQPRLNDLTAAIELCQNNLSELDAEAARLKEASDSLNTFKQLSRYESIFTFGNLDYREIDQIMLHLQHIIKDAYEAVFGVCDADFDCLHMLKRMESQMDQLHLICQRYPKKMIARARDKLMDTKRWNARKQQLARQREQHELKLQRTLEKVKMPPVQRHGRPLMFRSPPPCPDLQKLNIDWNKLYEDMEMRFFFEQ